MASSLLHNIESNTGGGLNAVDSKPYPTSLIKYDSTPRVKFGPHYGAANKQPPHLSRRVGSYTAGVCSSLLVPSVLFTATFAALSFKMHYQQTALCYFIVAASFLAVVLIGSFAWKSLKKAGSGKNHSETSGWTMFLFVTSLVAWMCGVSLGSYNYIANMQPFYEVDSLNTYTSINPKITMGQQVMDAGRIIFVEEARLDLSQSIAFQNDDLYCAVPITAGGTPLAQYDFWAVGVNCCNNRHREFLCGEFNNPGAHAGLRVTSEKERNFYALAVQQAKSSYKIKVENPIFLTWMQDPLGESTANQDRGMRAFLLGAFVQFAMQLFLVLVAILIFAKHDSSK